MTYSLTNCAYCGKPATKKCTRCKSVVYCNRTCQKKHFKDHKRECGALAVQHAWGGEEHNFFANPHPSQIAPMPGAAYSLPTVTPLAPPQVLPFSQHSKKMTNHVNSDDESDQSDGPPALIARHDIVSSSSEDEKDAYNDNRFDSDGSDGDDSVFAGTVRSRSDDSYDNYHRMNQQKTKTAVDNDVDSDSDSDSDSDAPKLERRNNDTSDDNNSDSDSDVPALVHRNNDTSDNDDDSDSDSGVPELVHRNNDTSDDDDDSDSDVPALVHRNNDTSDDDDSSDDEGIPNLIPRKYNDSSDESSARSPMQKGRNSFDIDHDSDDSDNVDRELELQMEAKKRRGKSKKVTPKLKENFGHEELLEEYIDPEKILKERIETSKQLCKDLCYKLEMYASTYEENGSYEKSVEKLVSQIFFTSLDGESGGIGQRKINDETLLWFHISETQTSQIFWSIADRKENAALELLKARSNELLGFVCRNDRKDDLVAILELGVSISSHRLVDIFKILPSNKGDQLNNRLANIIVKKCAISMKNKSDLKMIGNAINSHVGKQSKKKLLDLARDYEKKQNNTKRSGPKKQVIVDLPLSKKAVEKEKPKVTRQKNKKVKVKDTFKSKFESQITKSLKYYQELLEEWSSLERRLQQTSQEDDFKNDEENQEVRINNEQSKKLSSKQVAEFLTRYEEYSEGEKKDKEEEVKDLEMNMDLSDFNEESEWTIEMTEEAHKWFRKHTKRQNDFCQRVIARLKILSTGRWPYVLCKSLKTKKTNVQLYESKIDSGSRILWEVAVSFSPRRSSAGNPIWEQVIRVWDIVDDHDKLSDRIELAIDRIAQSCERGEQSCIYSELVVGEGGSERNKDGIAVPRVFEAKNCSQYEAIESKLSEKGRNKHYPPASHDPAQYTLLKFYQLNSDAIKMLLDSKNDQIDLPFTPGPKEHEIIHHKSNPPCSMLLQGRSGTGKTTCLVFRMWAQYMAYVEQQQGRQPRQLFITKNSVLRDEVEKSFGNMGLAYRKRRDVEHEHDYSNYLFNENKEDTESQDDGRFPLFLTSSEWLDVLDRELPGERFFTAKEIEVRSQTRNFLVDAVGRGIQAMLSNKNQEEKIEIIRQEMDFRTFLKLWPKINARQKTEIDPAMVWREIYTYIKGSVGALRLDDEDRDVPGNRYLNYDDYIALPRKQSRLNQEQRETVFNLYQCYEKLKKENQYYDAMDIVYQLAGRANKFSNEFIANRARGTQDLYKKLLPIDSLYVDEVQDFTMSELYLVTKLSTDQNNLMLAGDTAQSITEGVAFRFTDVRQIFFELFGGHVPDLLTLEHNYRSHSGILRLAACVVELLYFFFGDSLDRLAPDLGLFEGPKPIIMEMSSTEELALILQGKRENSRIEFGAHQVVIVRNEKVKDSLVKEFAIDREWIMTVQESKGLEFDDVLLYNFFTESEARDQWRVVSNYEEKDVKEYYSHHTVQSSGVTRYEWDELVKSGRNLEFSQEMHKVLETEMKILYTAITRARVNMFIVETDSELSSPMFTYFKQRKVVDEVSKQSKEGISNIPVFGKMSTEDDWRKQAENYLRQASGLGFGEKINQRLRLAAKCFEKAGELDRQKNVLAYLRYVGELENLTQRQEDMRRYPQKRERFYEIAAELLDTGDVNLLDKAGLCLFRSGDIEKARSASIFELYGRLSYARREKENSLAPDNIEQKNFSYAANIYEEISANESESLTYQKKHLMDAIRNHLYEGTNKGWKKASELIDSNVQFLESVSNEIIELFTPSKTPKNDPLSYLHEQMEMKGKTQNLHDSLSKLACLSM